MNQNLVELLKQNAVEAVNAGNPTSIVYGKVISVKPMQVQINNKLTLDEDFLVLTKNVSDYEAEIDIEFEGTGGIEIDEVAGQLLRKLSITGAKVKIKNAVKVGDSVVMIRKQGGQRYVVLDKVGD